MGLLYDKNNLLKPWAENESAFLKLNITNIKTMLQEITKTSGNVSNTRSMLLKRFNKAEADTGAVAGPSKREKKEHRRKNQKRKEKNILKQARNLLFLFSEEKADKILLADVKYNHVTSPDIKMKSRTLKHLITSCSYLQGI